MAQPRVSGSWHLGSVPPPDTGFGSGHGETARCFSCHRHILRDVNLGAVVGVGGCGHGHRFGAVCASDSAAAAGRACPEHFRVHLRPTSWGVPSAGRRDLPRHSPEEPLVDHIHSSGDTHGRSDVGSGVCGCRRGNVGVTTLALCFVLGDCAVSSGRLGAGVWRGAEPG